MVEGIEAFQVPLVVKNRLLMRETYETSVQSLGRTIPWRKK